MFLTEYLGGQVLDLAWGETKRRIMGRRLETARKVLVEELERGNAALADVEDADEAAAMVFEYADAAVQGAARRNLRMMAQILAGEVVRKPLYADEFLRWSRIIASLSAEELTVLACLHREVGRTDHPQLPFIELQKQMIGTGVCRDQNDVLGHLQALTRTGIIVPGPVTASVWKFTSGGERLMAMVGMEAVLNEPPR